MKRVLISLLISITMILSFIFYLDLINITSWLYGGISFKNVVVDISLSHLNKNVFKEVFIGILSIVTTTLAVLGTYYFTDKTNKESMKRQEEIFKEERKDFKEQVKLEKEIAYRNMNKANTETILREVLKLAKNSCFLVCLIILEEQYKIPEMFGAQNRVIVEETSKFLEKLKGDFYYDDEVVVRIEGILLVIKENLNFENGSYETRYFYEYYEKVINFYLYFYNSNDENTVINFEEIFKNSLRKLWQQLFFAKNYPNKIAKEYILYALKEDVSRVNGITSEDEKLIKNVVDNKEILEVLNELKEDGIDIFNDPESIKLILELKNKIGNWENNYILNLIRLYVDIYESKIDNKVLIEELGKDNKEIMEKFVICFYEKNHAHERENYIEEFVEKYKYL